MIPDLSALAAVSEGSFALVVSVVLDVSVVAEAVEDAAVAEAVEAVEVAAEDVVNLV